MKAGFKLFSLVTLVTLVLGLMLAACSKSTTTTTTKTTTAAATTTTAKTTTAPATTTTAARPNITVGVGYALTSEPGKRASESVQLAAEQINAAGGVDVAGVKYNFKLVIADTNELVSPTDAAAAAERLISVNGAQFFIGTQSGTGGGPVMEVLADHKVVGFINSTTASALIFKDYNRYKYIYPGVANGSDVLYAIMTNVIVAGKALNKIGVEKPKVALLFQKMVDFDPMVGAFTAMLPKFGFEVVGAWRPALDATDVTAELNAIQASGAQIILQGLTGPAAIAIANTWGQLKIPAAVVGINSYGEDSFWAATGGNCNYELQLNLAGGRSAVTPKTIPYLDAFQARFGHAPTISIAPYDLLYILADSITRAGTLNSDAVTAAVEKTDYTGALGRFVFLGMDAGATGVHYNKYGPGYVFYTNVQWINGKVQAVWPDGDALPWNPAWAGVKYPGTQAYVLPPWVVSKWATK